MAPQTPNGPSAEPSPSAERGPLAWIIAACARNPWLTLLLVGAAAVAGIFALRDTPMDAIPDLSDVQVIVQTDWPGRSPDLIEDQLTYPISATLLAAPRVEAVRGSSAFGTSWIYVIFEEGTDLYWARSRVMEELSALTTALPEGVKPRLGPDATGIGWVYQYALVDRSGQTDLQQLRDIQDWNLKLALESVSGVAEVASIGGFVKQYQVDVDPERMRAWGVRLPEVVEAVKAASGDAGGHVIELGGHEHMIRGRGYISSVEDLALAPLAVSVEGAPIRIADVAEVHLAPAPRQGIADLNGEGEVVAGIVVMRQGENALRVIQAVKERLEEVGRGLPEGVEIVTVYDRSELIEGAISTLRHTLVEEMVVVSVVIALFLMHLRSALLPVISLPVAVLLAFLAMRTQGLTADIMSLGGIAVAIGAMVDGSVVVVENIHKRLDEWQQRGSPGARREVVIGAMQEVGPAIFYSLLVLTVSFLPIFSLTGTEGRMFRPLAWTKTWSMAFAALLALTLTPALAVLLIRGKVRAESDNPMNRWLVAVYSPVVRWVVRHRWAVLGMAALAMLATVPAALSLRGEFMPPLNEGSLLYMPTAPPGMSQTEAGAVLQAMNREIYEVPEVRSVFGKMGRAQTATDPAPLGMAETVVLLKPKEEWREGLSWGDLVGELDRKLRVPGMPNIWWMPIQTRTEMLATGVRAPIGVQVFGDDPQVIERVAVQIAEVLEQIEGTRSASAERSAGGFYLDITVDRYRAARHGVTVADVNAVISTAIGGMPVAETLEGRARYPIAVRYAPERREDPEQLGRVLVPTRQGGQIPLSWVADITGAVGPDMIRSEDGKLLSLVSVDPGSRALAEYVEEAKAVVASQVERPPGVRVDWTGQFKYYERANERLMKIIPLTLLLVVLLIYLNRRSAVETAIVLLAVPFSLIGAFWLLWALDYHMSVAVWVGLIALAGLDAETGIVMLLYLRMSYDKAKEEGRIVDFAALTEVVVDGAARRIRPKTMTVVTTLLGLLPILWSTGIGADVMKRIAAPMVGGLVTSFFLELTVYPALFAIWKGRGLLPGVERQASEGA